MTSQLSQDHYERYANGVSPTRVGTNDTHFDNEEKLRYELAKTVTLTPDLYEKLFISPKTQVAGDLRKTFGNPTPIGVLGFSVSVFALSCSYSTSSSYRLLRQKCPANTSSQWDGEAQAVLRSQPPGRQSGSAAYCSSLQALASSCWAITSR